MKEGRETGLMNKNNTLYFVSEKTSRRGGTDKKKGGEVGAECIQIGEVCKNCLIFSFKWQTARNIRMKKKGPERRGKEGAKKKDRGVGCASMQEEPVFSGTSHRKSDRKKNRPCIDQGRLFQWN